PHVVGQDGHLGIFGVVKFVGVYDRAVWLGDDHPSETLEKRALRGVLVNVPAIGRQRGTLVLIYRPVVNHPVLCLLDTAPRGGDHDQLVILPVCPREEEKRRKQQQARFFHSDKNSI